MVENLPNSPRNETFASLAKDVVSVHGISLAAASLSVSKDGTVVALHDVLDHLLANDVEDFFLASLRTEDMVEGESRVVAVSNILFLEPDALLIVTVEYHLTLLWIEFNELFLYFVVGSESGHDLDRLFVDSASYVGRDVGDLVAHDALTTHLRGVTGVRIEVVPINMLAELDTAQAQMHAFLAPHVGLVWDLLLRL